MGKSIASTAAGLKELARLLSSSPEKLQRGMPRHARRPPPHPSLSPKVVRARPETKTRPIGSGVKVESSDLKKSRMNINWDTQQQQRLPLSQVVSDCMQRWFQDTLREAKNGDNGMEILVGQMYKCGYGVPKNEKKGHAWIRRAAMSRSFAWKVSDKLPGYAASDSDSDDLKGDTK